VIEGRFCPLFFCNILNGYILKSKSKYFILGVIVVILDQITKKYFESILEMGQSIKVIGEEFFKFTLVYNPGIAFGIRLGGQYILSGISVIASIIIIIYMKKLDKSKVLELWAFGMILGGAVGNLIDRALYGKVIDFLDFDFPDLIMVRWPVFNVADSFVTIGMVLLAIQYLILDVKKEKMGKE